MQFPLRRVVTGHDSSGRAIVQIDDIPDNVVSKRPAHESFVVWTTVGHPVDNDGTDDEAKRPVGTALEEGTVFRIMRLMPGVAPRRHRTNSVDYLVVLSGAVTMELDDGCSVDMKAGDLMVQRGTIHNWVNKGTEPCVMAVVLIEAKPVSAGGKALDAVG
jgi:quercetin dioxygenase-like cupin family protein